MNGYFDLENVFPTDESRYNAYIYWIIDCSILLLIFVVALGADSLLLNLISILAELSLIVVNIYLTIYIWNKRKILKTMFRIVGSFTIGALICLILSNSLFKYIPPPSMIVALLFCILPECLIIALNRKKFQRVTRIFGDEFVKYSLVLIALHVVIPYVLLFISFCYGILSNYYTPAADWSVTLLAFSYVIFFLSEPIFIMYIFKKEKGTRSTFYNTVVRFYLAEFLLLYCIFAITAFLDGDTLIDDVGNSINNIGHETVDVENSSLVVNDGSKEIINHVNLNFRTESNSAPLNDTPVTNESAAGNDSSPANDKLLYDGANENSINNMSNIGLIEFFTGTNMADIPNIQHHPYMIFYDPLAHGNFQICDPNGMPQMTVSNGNIVNSEYVVIGHVNTDAVSGTITYTDISNNPLYSVDSHGQMFSGKHYIGRTDIGENVTVIRDMNDNIIARYDELSHTWFDAKTSQPISQIKPM